MAVSSANIPWKICYQLQFQVFTIPWTKRSTLRFCLNGREFCSSSMPVRYIPKKNSKSDDQGKEPLKSRDVEKKAFDKSSVGVRSFGSDKKPRNQKPIRTGKWSFDNVPGDLDSTGNSSNRIGFSQEIFAQENNRHFGMESHEAMEEPEDFATEMGCVQEKAINQQNVPLDKSMKDAEKSAIGLLATRAFTAVELRKKLLGKRFPPDVVEALIINFQHRGLINDSLYAETFSRSRWSSLTWGPRRIKQALYKKGVSNEDAEKALELVFHDSELGCGHSKLSLSKIFMDHLLAQASKQWLRGKDVSKETRKSRIVHWLQYRGFSWDVINIVMRELESQHPL